MALDMMMKNGENDDKVHFILYIFVFFCGERWRRVGKREGFFDLEGKGIARRPGQGTDQRSCLPSKVLTLRSLFVFFFPGHLKRHKRHVFPLIVQHVFPLTQESKGKKSENS